MKATLDDVAKEAGVSRATVDRVLNERGNVRRDTVEKVYRAAVKTNFFVDPHVSAYSQIRYKFDFILPIIKTKYFDNFYKQIQNSTEAFANMNVRVVPHMIENGLDPKIMAQSIIEIGQDSDGVAMVAVDHPVVRQAVDSLYEQGVGAISLVSDISRSQRLAYVGLDNRAAGRTSALLMGRFLSSQRGGDIALFPGRPSYRGHEEREAGFKSMIRERFSRFNLLDVDGVQDDNDIALERTVELLKTNQDLVSIYNIGGGTNGIADAINQSEKQQDVVFIAHELNDTTRQYLIDGTVDVIINQSIGHEIFSAVELLLKHSRSEDLNITVRQPRVEIYLSENVY